MVFKALFGRGSCDLSTFFHSEINWNIFSYFIAIVWGRRSQQKKRRNAKVDSVVNCGDLAPEYAFELMALLKCSKVKSAKMWRFLK